jgi:hypothetical protein
MPDRWQCDVYNLPGLPPLRMTYTGLQAPAAQWAQEQREWSDGARRIPPPPRIWTRIKDERCAHVFDPNWQPGGRSVCGDPRQSLYHPKGCELATHDFTPATRIKEGEQP